MIVEMVADSHKSRFWTPFVISLLITPIFVVLGFVSGGMGHGDYFLTKSLFPLTMLSTVAFETITPPFVVLGLAQFPVYGVILGFANEKGRFKQFLLLILAVHIVLVMACFMFIGENFSKHRNPVLIILKREIDFG